MRKSTLNRLTLFFFQLTGMCTFTDDPRQPRLERLLLLWTIANMCVLVSIVAVVAKHPAYVLFDNDAIGALTDTIQMVSPFFAHFTLLFEAIRTKSMRLLIWRQFHDIDRRLQTHLGTAVDVINRNGLNRYFLKVAIAHAVCLATEIRIMSCIGENVIWWNLWMASIFTMTSVRSHHFYYIWYVDQLRWRMDVCCAELASERRADAPDRLKWLQEIHGEFWLISERINEAFGWCLLTTVTANFVCLSVNLYWNYAALYFGTNKFWVESLMGSVPLAVGLMVLCYSGEHCHRAASNFSSCLHRLTTSNERSTKSLVNLFSLQIRLQRFHLSASGFFLINFVLLKEIVAAIATYMLIFIQFMPSDDVFYEDNAKNKPSNMSSTWSNS